jgi:hypothetical protein
MWAAESPGKDGNRRLLDRLGSLVVNPLIKVAGAEDFARKEYLAGIVGQKLRTGRNPKMPRSRVLAFVIKEIKEMIPPTLFFAVGFNIVLLTTQLILNDYLVQLASFLVATGAALVVGKAVQLANALPFLRRFDRAPLIQPILFKTLIYFAVVSLVRFLEKIIEYWFGGGAVADIPDYVTAHFSWNRFTAIQIWIFILFLIYVTATELNALVGDGELFKIFFTRRSSEQKLTRRQRIRSFVRPTA